MSRLAFKLRVKGLRMDANTLIETLELFMAKLETQAQQQEAIKDFESLAGLYESQGNTIGRTICETVAVKISLSTRRLG